MTTAKRDLHAVFSRRAILLSGGGVFAIGAITARLAYLQAENVITKTYTNEANENRFDQRIIVPPRGVLYDRFGEMLAVTSPDYRVTLVPEQVGLKNLDATIRKIGDILHLPEDIIRRRLKDAQQAKRSDVVIIRQGLRWDEFTAINVRLPDLPGVRAESSQIRRYPYDIAFAHPIGYVQKPTQRDVDRAIEAEDGSRAVYYKNPDVRVGRAGLEVNLEDTVHGKAGWRLVEVNAAGRVVNEVGGRTQEPLDGAAHIMTLDAEVQRTAMEQMRGKSGACVVMDIWTGDLIALASSPGFDPNEFVNGIGQERFKELNEDPYKPLFNKTVTGEYKPGSTFKICTGIAAVAAGLPDDFRVNCPGFFPFGGRAFHCWKRGGHGTVNFHEAMKGSCNVFFYQAGLRAGQQRIADTARLLGIGEKFKINMPAVRNGIVPDEAWWKANREGDFAPGMTLNTAIGQGDLLVTPLQLCVMMARVANGGHAVVPRLVREGPDFEPDVKTPPKLNLDAAGIARVLSGIFGVASEPGGTAYRSMGQLGLWYDPATNKVVEAETAPPGYKQVQTGGKTGTAQVRVITAAERARGVLNNNDIAWERRDHALFVCHGPTHKSRYACAIVIEHGGPKEQYVGGGSAAAAPIAREVMRQVLLRDPSNRKGASLKTLSAAVELDRSPA
jgi:penicillin-binding protein 2